MNTPALFNRADLTDLRVKKVLEILEKKPAAAVEDLASSVNLSSSQLERIFKTQTGMCLGRYISDVKLHHAANLLTTTQAQIKAIALETGYKHSSSFVRAFFSRFSQSPLSYRSRMRDFANK